MADTPIRMPFLERRRDNLAIQKQVQANSATTFPARSFVKLSAGALVPCVTADVLCFGWCADSSKLSTDQPPVTLYGQNHWAFDPKDSQFIVNITSGAGLVGQAAGAPQLSAVSVGTEYGLYRDATTFMQMLKTDDTTNKFFRVVAIYPNQSLQDYNGLVLVQIVDAALQG
jgi:hypothetical protein